METASIQFNQPYLDFLLSLADFSSAANILWLSGIISPDVLPASIKGKVVTVDIRQEPSSAMESLKGFDLALIVPAFGRVGREDDLGFPPSWDLSSAAAQRHVEDAWLAWAICATAPGGQILSVTSQGMLNSTLREPIRQRVIEEGLHTVISLGATYRPETSVNAALLMIKRGPLPEEITLVDTSQMDEEADWILASEAIRHSRLFQIRIPGLWFTQVNRESLMGKSRLDPYFYHPKFLRIEAPAGYTEVLLSDIAEIRGGRSLASMRSLADRSQEAIVPYVQVGNIKPEGNLDLEWARAFPKSLRESSKAGWAGPGDILITVAGTLGKVCLIQDSYADGVYYDTSIRRIRVNQEVASLRVVYDFLKSEVAQLQIDRYASGSVIPTISSADLGSIRVFLPTQAVETEVGEPDSQLDRMVEAPKLFSQVIAEVLRERVVSPLLVLDVEQSPDWRAETVERLQEIMHQIQKDNEPLHELVTRHYPLPIALAYRRMMRAYHNPYEQVNRLVELYESLTHFFYYVLLSDYLRNPLLQKHFHPREKATRRAYEGFSMDRRLKFMKGLLDTVKGKQRSKDADLLLSVPELLNVDLYSPLNQLRQLRNASAHSAAGTPAAQKALFDENWPLVENLLGQARFLREYPLCRVRGFHTKRSRIILTIEYFQGALYETDIREQEAPSDEDGNPKLITSDRDHVILLNPQFDWLDLHPFYQVITSKEYRYESHLCFHKQVARDEHGQQCLLGESIQFRREFQLPGFEDLQRLAGSARL